MYASVGVVANKWLDMLETKGEHLTDEDLVEYISEATTMSKSLEEYGDRKIVRHDVRAAAGRVHRRRRDDRTRA